MAFFRYEGHKLDYTIHGRGSRTAVLMPGLLLSQKMHRPLASADAVGELCHVGTGRGRLGALCHPVPLEHVPFLWNRNMLASFEWCRAASDIFPRTRSKSLVCC